MDVKGKLLTVAITLITLSLISPTSAETTPRLEFEHQTQVDVRLLRSVTREHPGSEMKYQPTSIQDAIEEKSFNIDQEDISDTGMLRGEHIDTRTGKLHWEVTELVVPGNGGLEIHVSRSFEKGGDAWRPHFGNYGSWEIELPRIEIPQTPEGRSRGQEGKRGICIDPKPTDDSLNSKDEIKYWSGMQLLMPNAAPRPIYLRHKTAQHFDGAKYVTEDNWAIHCARDEKGLWGNFKVLSPNGVEYRLSRRSAQSGISTERGMQTYYVTEVKDPSGNWLRYDYYKWSIQFSNNDTHYIHRITASDGREVTFDYEKYYPPGANVYLLRLKKIRYQDKEWKYHYDRDNSLSRAVRPDGSESRYAYQDYKKRYGGYLHTVTTPEGAKVTYSYKDWYIRNFGASSSKYRHRLITSRVLEGPGLERAEWKYNLTRDNQRQENITEITGPTHTERYRFHRTADWKLGLLKTHEIYPTKGTGQAPLKVIDYEWAPQSTIGFTEAYVKPDFYFTTIGVPKVLRKRTINGRYETEYRGHDVYGKPSTIIERGDKDRTIKLTYEHRPKGWLIGLPKSEEIQGVGSIERAYNSAGKLIKQSNYGQETSYDYHATGDLAKKCWQKDQQTYCEQYDDYKHGKPQKIRDANGYSSQQSINAMGKVASVTDKEGNSTYYQYDRLGRLKNVKPPIQSETTITWITPRKRQSVKGDIKTTSEYNALGKLIRERQEDQTSGDTIYIKKEYDALGRNTYETQPSHEATGGYGIKKRYDALGRILSLTHTGTGATTRVCHDQCSEVPSMRLGRVITNARGYLTKQYQEAYGDPAKGQVIRIEQQVGDGQKEIVTRMQYNLLGNMTSVSQGAAGEERSHLTRAYQYNNKQRLEKETHPETGETGYTYDEVGNVKTKTQGKLTTRYEYDANNQLKKEIYADGSETEYAYDKNGSIKQLKNEDSQWDYQYNAMGQLTHESLIVNTPYNPYRGTHPPEGGQVNFRLNYQYDNQGRLVGYRYPNGDDYSITSDGFGRTKSIAGLINHVEYHANQEVKSLKLANGIETRRAQNKAQLPEKITTQNLINGEIIQTLGYQYDGQYNITAIEDQRRAITKVMRYDGIERLTSVERLYKKTNEHKNRSYQYDAIGNINHKLATSENDQIYKYQTNTNRLTDVSGYPYDYDAQGNVITDGRNQYHYNAANRLVSLKTKQGQQSYRYDPHGRRIERDTEVGITFEVHNQAGQLVYEQKETGEDTSYFYLGGQLVAKIKNGAGLQEPDEDHSVKVPQRQIEFLHTNLQGSVEAATDGTGNLLWHEGYQAFGKRTEKTQSVDDALSSFTGKLEDPTTGLIYMNARYYDPNIGRFLAIDPVGFTPENLQSFNRYLYVNNNPYKYTDPTGEFLHFAALGYGLVSGAMTYAATGSLSEALYTGAVDGLSMMTMGAGAYAVGKLALTGASKIKSWGKVADWAGIATDAAIGAVSSYSGTKATGGSNQEAMKNAAFGGVFGAVLGRTNKPKTINKSIVKGGALGFSTNASAQGIEIGLSKEKTFADFSVNSAAISGLAGMVTGGLGHNAPSGLAVDIAAAPRSTIVESSITGVGERLFGN